VNRRPIVMVPALLAVALVLTALGLGVGSAWTGLGGASVPPSASPVPNEPAGPSTASVSSEPPSAPASAPAPSASATPVAAEPDARVPIVPVVNFRNTATASSLADVKAILAGTSSRYQAVELIDGEADAILLALGVERPAAPGRLVLARDAAQLAADLTRSGKRLAFLRADEVTPAVRALSWGGAELYGVDRVRTLAAWPLSASLPVAPAGQAFDPAATWTLFAGGDMLLDRGVYQTVKLRRKGIDFPFDGGTAEITSRYCCSTFGWELPRTQRTGNAGAVRGLIEGADLAIANFENPAPDKPRYHTSGTTFSADPALIAGIADAGIDYVSLANNHIRDAGGAGLLQTIANLKQDGIASSGSGKNLAAARKPGVFTVDGTKVAILAYDAIAAGYHATATRIGSAPLVAGYVREDVKAARAAGADVVIVFPHWGTEYKSKPFAGQQQLARMIIDAGADMVIGNHAHWAAAMEVYKGKPIWYALGNFVFDQTWSEPTMEGITLELTFRGATLAQVRIRPHIILDKAQPNFLDPAGDGKIVMGRVYSASKGLLPW
ncbi:MAG TPA: CapA family protein, partial [Candidatus Limnocylindrales bacterium]